MSGKISVVIGFKDWGVDRLSVALRALAACMAEIDGEVIVSDYGSEDGPVLREVVEELGGVYVYTETDGTWSRSRALNAGFAIASGSILISTDADMLFSPATFAAVREHFEIRGRCALALQCRDLPQGYGPIELQETAIDWDQLERVSLIRPRWGMGGLMAVDRETYALLRGFDERLQIYGGEDIDFANRVRRAGLPLNWLDDPRARMYHMWHEPTRGVVEVSEDGKAAIAFNRDVMLNDKSIIRNLPTWQFALRSVDPIVSVVIATKDRPEYLRESIESALNQTFEDIEVLVVADGCTSSTDDVVAEFKDSRLRYFRREASGVAASRNFAATVSRGIFTVIHDDDDIMIPNRIENHLRAISIEPELAVGSFSGWIDFDDSNGALVAQPGSEFSLASIVYRGRALAHGTTMIRTEIIRSVGYDESLRSGSDFNLFVRIARLGLHLVHTGSYAILRRLHGEQVTSVDSAVQKSSATSTVAVLEAQLGPNEVAKLRKRAARIVDVQLETSPRKLLAELGGLLPGDLVRRTVLVSSSVSSSSQLSGDDWIEFRDGDRLEVRRGVDWREFLSLSKLGMIVSDLSENSSEPVSLALDRVALTLLLERIDLGGRLAVQAFRAIEPKGQNEPGAILRDHIVSELYDDDIYDACSIHTGGQVVSFVVAALANQERASLLLSKSGVDRWHIALGGPRKTSSFVEEILNED
ncbi:glycosyltransferase family 2 protein [Paraoerskovia marina]|uniref:glycosyltransferase family 2 protein n=1 Tax=Paraoerskovia marina TaxID=545619 RepID=UPI0009DFD1AC|nr:glycosyltransferase [Paraoerskovia marina]